MGRPQGPRKKEHYYLAAKKHGYRARSAYKLRQIIKKHRLLRGVNRVVELCCAPGGWTQVLLEFDPGLQIIAIDLSTMAPLKNVRFIQGDINDPKVLEQIESLTDGRVDLVLADCSPRVTGAWELDAARQLALAERTIDIAMKFLTDDGKVLTKVFQGPGFQEFLKETRAMFTSVRLIKPEASRRTSAEIYLLAAGPKRDSLA